MTMRRVIHDFGFDPEQGPYHFQIVKGGDGGVTIFEWFAWEADETDDGPSPEPKPKASLDAYRWSRISLVAAENFNERLRRAGLKPATWKKKEALLAPHFGKELTLLMWAVEDGDPTLIPNITANWAGFAPEERWWLYTTVNATSGHSEHGRDRGWRKAIKIGLAENPTQGQPLSALAELGPLPGFENVEKVARRKRQRSKVSSMQNKLPLDDS